MFSPQTRITREGGGPDLWSADGRMALIWIPAFAGKTGGGGRDWDEEEDEGKGTGRNAFRGLNP